MEYTFHQLSAIIILLAIIASAQLFGPRNTKLYLGLILIVLISALIGEKVIENNGAIFGGAFGLLGSAIFGVLAERGRNGDRTDIAKENA